MVSQRERRRRSSVSLSAVAAGWLLVAACSRHAEIEEDPRPGELPVMEVPRPDGGIPVVEDAELSNAEGLSCNERARQPACGGANDFGCDFDGWLQLVAEACQQQTDCRTNGWVEVLLDADGCASELRMQEPNPDYVACLARELSSYQCPCRNVVGSRFLGLSHEGCEEAGCGTGELRCPPGSSCVEGKCRPD